MKLDNISTIDNMLLKEMQIQIGKQSNSGQIVFLAGAPGSGKNWVINNMTDIKNRFKIFDIDDVKEKIVSYDKLMSRFLSYVDNTVSELEKEESISGLDHDKLQTYRLISSKLRGSTKKMVLTNKKVQDALHEYLIVSSIMPKKIENLLKTIIKDPEKLPNLAFNAPLRQATYPNSLLELLFNMGYLKSNVSVLWVVSSVEDIMQRTLDRGKNLRATNQQYLLMALKQVSNTMTSIINGDSILSDKIERVYVVYNNAKYIERYDDSDIIKKFKYDEIKIGDTSKIQGIMDELGEDSKENDDE